MFVDRVGERFGRLVIIAKAPGRKKWLVRCDCGVEKVVIYGNLKTSTKSCGCLKSEGNWAKDVSGVPFGMSTRNTTLLEYKLGAKSRNLNWDLLDEQFDILTKANCHYCGREPSNIKKSKYNKGDFVYQGIDRIDNSKGYEIKNCVPCCKICNRAKDTMTQEDFYSWIDMVFSRKPI